ncbi:hypothetical protein UP17_17200 [Peribacillus simplex]|uniref:glycosyltransferase family 4 protein n=1 Tax=Peribacillus simplex TaxID=1478 RepID=UPI000776F3E4|nr:glycosyltransferase family 4 protein [Peribacillus simplex]AMM94002.1 hypothetical protein UP17_17200 [Peribacillus simplex]
MFLLENEQKFKHEITLFSIYSKEAMEQSKKYKHCDIRYIKTDSLKDKFDKMIRYIINRQNFFYIGNNYISKVKKEIKNCDQFDAVIIENNAEYGLKLYNIAKGKLILHLHNDWLNSKTKLANKKLNCYKNVFTISDYINKSVSTIKETDNIKTLYNGVNISEFERENNSNESKIVKEKYGIKEDEKVILYTGRLVPEKGIKELILAFSKLPENLKVKLVIVGSATYGETKKDRFYRDLIKMAEAIKEKIIFTGYIDYKDMPSIYSIADIGVIPSLCEEAFNLTVVENMAAGIPVIISDAGAMPELINSKCGMIVKRGDMLVDELKIVMERLLKDEVLRQKMSKYNRVHSYNYNSNLYSVNFNKLLEEFN